MLANILKGATAGELAFVSSAITQSANASVTVTAPLSIRDGDLLVGFGFHRSASQTISYPSGFTGRLINGSSTNTLFMATKVATFESGNYTFAWGSAVANAVALLVYRRATDSDRLVGSLTRASAATTSASSISPTDSGVLVGFFASETSRGTAAGGDPSGMVLRASAVGSASTVSLYLYDILPNDAGATGGKTITWRDTSDTASFLVQLYSA